MYAWRAADWIWGALRFGIIAVASYNDQHNRAVASALPGMWHTVLFVVAALELENKKAKNKTKKPTGNIDQKEDGGYQQVIIRVQH